MTDIFKTKYTKADMEAADDPQWGVAVTQVPSDMPFARVPSQNAKWNWPSSVENVTRPRFGRGAGYKESE